MDQQPVQSGSTRVAREQVTSMRLPRGLIVTCWAIGMVSVGAGAVATFTTANQGGSAALIVFGSAAIFLALIRRVPLSLEVAGTKLDATYLQDRAFEAGRDSGYVAGLEIAENDLISSAATTEGGLGLSDDVIREVAERLSDRKDEVVPPVPTCPPIIAAVEAKGYRGPTACRAAGITYRQLDYWTRTGLVEPSIRPHEGPNAPALYSFRDIVCLNVGKRLLETGVSLQYVRTVISDLRMLPSNEPLPKMALGDANTAYRVGSIEDARTMLFNGKGFYGIALDPIVDDISRELRSVPGA